MDPEEVSFYRDSLFKMKNKVALSMSKDCDWNTIFNDAVFKDDKADSKKRRSRFTSTQHSSVVTMMK